MYSTADNLWTFTWFVHFELSFRLKGTDKIHTERFFKFPSNIYFILYVDMSRDHTAFVWCTVYSLWTFTWIIDFELSFRLKGTDKIHTEGLFKSLSIHILCSVIRTFPGISIKMKISWYNNWRTAVWFWWINRPRKIVLL